MVNMKASEACGSHIFSENGLVFGLADLLVAKICIQKYKKYDVEMRLCTDKRFPLIWALCSVGDDHAA